MRHGVFSPKVLHVELQFTDLLGKLRVIDVSTDRYLEALEKGKVFDGSSVHMAPVESSDLILKPIPETTFELPWNPTAARVLCDIHVSDDGMRECENSPRFMLKKQLEKTKEKGFEFFTAAEHEFFILNSGEVVDKSGYFSSTPLDGTKKLRQKLFETLPRFGVDVEYMHHEVAEGQAEITLRVNNALKMADNVMTFRYFAHNTAAHDNLTITFMPKFRAGINGSGLHFHMSLQDSERHTNVFYDESDPYRLSETARQFMAGVLEHFKAIAGLAAPTINSRKRLVPGYEAPINKAWGPKNRSALIRIPSFTSQNGARIELRMIDSTCNPYLVTAIMLAAGMEGIEKKLEPGEPYLKNTFENEHEFAGKALPGTQEKLIEELKNDGLVAQVMGADAFARYLHLKETELAEYKKIHKNWNPFEITPWELEKYLIW